MTRIQKEIDDILQDMLLKGGMTPRDKEEINQLLLCSEEILTDLMVDALKNDQPRRGAWICAAAGYLQQGVKSI